jgi:hypothetical protein
MNFKLSRLLPLSFPHFYAIIHFSNLPHFNPEDGSNILSEILVPVYQSAWYHNREDNRGIKQCIQNGYPYNSKQLLS